MASIAEALSKNEDVILFLNKAEKVKAAYNKTFFDRTTKVYKDGNETDHSSLHANMFALALIYVELVGLIIQELSNLPEQQATIFRMSYLEGLSTQEICEHLGTTTNTVYFARSKALSTLKKVFEQRDLKLYVTFLHLVGAFIIKS